MKYFRGSSALIAAVILCITSGTGPLSANAQGEFSRQGNRAASSGVSGDVNNDGQFNVADMVSFVSWLQGKTADIETANADLSGDGAVDVFDLVAMRRELVKAVVSTAKPLLIIDSGIYGGIPDPDLPADHSNLISVYDSMGIMSIRRFEEGAYVTDKTCTQICGQTMADPLTKGQITEGDVIAVIKEFSAKAAKFRNTKMAEFGSAAADCATEQMYILYPDTDGNLKPLLLATRGGIVSELDDDEAREFIMFLAEHGIFWNKDEYLREKNTVETPAKMPVIHDAEGIDITVQMKQDIWSALARKYPDTDLTAFTLKYEPEHPLGDLLDGRVFDVYYNDLRCLGRSYLNVDDSIYVTADPVEIHLNADIDKLMAVDVNAKCMAPEDLARKYTFDPEKDHVEKVIYAPKKDSKPVLAYRVITPASNGETIINAVTGQLVEYIPYTVE